MFCNAFLLSILSSLAAGAVVDLPISIRNSYSVVPVSIGTPAQTHYLFFDTGSSTAWLNSVACGDQCPNQSGFGRNPYNKSSSSTSEDLGISGDIQYFGGSVAGSVFSDEWSLAPTKGRFSWSQTFLDVDQSTWRFIPGDGFLGLAFSSIASPNTSTVFETLMQKGLLDRSRFGVYYGNNLTNGGSNSGRGQLTLGGSKEKTYVDGKMTYIPLHEEVPYEVWRVDLGSIITSTKKNSRSCKSREPKTKPTTINFAGRAVFDTGAGAIQLPPNVIYDVYDSIGYNYTQLLTGQRKIRCAELNSSLSVNFVFGNKANSPSVMLTGDQLKFPGFAGDPSLCTPPFEDSGLDNFALFGPNFLTRFYSVFDFGAFDVAHYKPRVGFGKLKRRYQGYN